MKIGRSLLQEQLIERADVSDSPSRPNGAPERTVRWAPTAICELSLLPLVLVDRGETEVADHEVSCATMRT